MIILDAIVQSCTSAVTLVCFVNVCVAAQMALTVISLIYFGEKSLCMCMLFDAKNPATLCFVF